ncbi:Alpha-L-arabinofuranosidase 1 [Diplonema papillatum]|nr:Alpha-L-arabinofuranosidase 1 [Diplonema papillatum]KAJ9441602.1 Alpha-L-arabinofuranosidase 1 [Diplonema papillatum]
MLLPAVVALATLAQNTVSIANMKVDALKPNHYSMFWETEINFGGEGGLYAELVWNRDFEALGRGNSLSDPPAYRGTRADRREALRAAANAPREDSDVQLDPKEPPADYSSYAPWTGVGGAALAVQNDTAPFETNPMSLEITASAPNSGAFNPGYWGMAIRSGVAYNLSMFAMSPNVSAVVAQIVCNGEAVASVSISITPKWNMWEATVYPSSSCPDGGLQVLASAAGVVYLDHVSLFPGDAVLGLFRSDLMQYLSDFKPPMIRIPGGNYLEGTGPRTRWQWKNTVGPRQQRSGHYNSAWGYWVTDGIGLMELLLLCDFLGAEPLLSIYTGYSLGQNYIPLNESQVFVDDCLDLMEYSTGNTSTLWGHQRELDGHAAPFVVSKLEIGNEEFQQGKEGYAGHYQLITVPLRQRYPNIFVVASGIVVATSGGRSSSCLPCVGGCDGMQPQQCDAWDEHTYDTPDSMAANLNLYDNYYNTSFCQTIDGGRCPPVYVLEYGCHETPEPDLMAGVSEGVFLLGTEINANAVEATAFAPLFVNVRGQQWGYNLINFNASNTFALPSYYVQQMLRATTGDYTVMTNRSAQAASPAKWTAIASVKSGNGSSSLFVKVANYGTPNTAISFNFSGFTNLQLPTAGSYVGGTNGTIQNTLSAPTVVGIRQFPLQSQGQSLQVIMDTYSVLVFEATFEPSK